MNPRMICLLMSYGQPRLSFAGVSDAIPDSLSLAVSTRTDLTLLMATRHDLTLSPSTRQDLTLTVSTRGG